MRLPDRKDWIACAGCLAAIAALALSLPGVRIARADDAGAAASDEAAALVSVALVDSARACDPSAESLAPQSARVLLVRARDRSEDPDPIALNNEGYSYRPPSVDPEARRLERH